MLPSEQRHDEATQGTIDTKQQVVIGGGDNAAAGDDDEVETVNREEEIIKKRKTELTTTRQTETRIKRQLLFEDGKVIEDSGPIVSTNTLEDTDRQETVQTEHRALGDPAKEQPGTPGDGRQDELGHDCHLPAAAHSKGAESTSTATTPKKRGDGTTVAALPDGLLRNVKEEVSVSREHTTERTEVAEQQHFGDFTDEAYLGVVRSGVGGDIRELLLSEKGRAELSPPGQPQVVQHTVQTKKVIDREDTDIRQLVKPDGTLVTEKQQTRQHEEVHDDELPPDSGAYPLPSLDQAHNDERLIEQKSSAQRYYKQRDEQHVDLLENGRVIGHEMRYAAEQTQLEKDGQTVPGEPGMLSDWDSLSDRLRKARRLGRHPKELAPLGPGNSKANQHGAGLGFPATGGPGPGPNDRLDALTKKPLDFDMEEETRKHETNKWLECHFGSESRSSRDSHEELDELLVEPTKKTYFNVTIKSTDGTGSLLGTDTPDHHRPNYSGQSVSAGAKRDLLDASKGEPTGLYPAVTPLNWSNRGPGSSSPGCREDRRGSREDTPFGSGTGGRGGYRKGFRETKKHESPEQVVTDKTGSYITSPPYVTEPRATELGGDGPRDRPPRQPYGGHPEPPDGRPQVPQRRKQLAQSFAAGREQDRSLQEHQPLQHQARQQHLQQQYPPNARQQYEVKPARGVAIVHGYGPRSRSVSPIPIPPVMQTMRKPYQKTRFSSIQDLSHGHGQGGGERSVSRPQSALSKSNFVGSAIGKSFRKLMGKIRSNSAERKLKMKSSKLQQQQQHQPQRSSSPVSSLIGQGSARLKHQSTTYQQYNVIDGHISNSGSPPPTLEQQRDAHVGTTDLPLSDGPDRPTLRRNGHRTQQQQQEVVDGTSGSGLTPRQTYYLGENPYGAGSYGKENKYSDATATDMSDTVTGVGPKVPGRHYTSSQPRVFQHLPHSNRHSNLGRFSKSTNRLPTSSHGGHYEHPEVQYLSRPVASLHTHSSQTLPRNDLHHQHNKLHHGSKPLHSSTINVSIVNRVNLPTTSPVAGQSQVLATSGPVKPARSYKTLNRSKSFNVHGLNGTNDPSPIYLEKLQRNQHTPVSGFYRSSSYLEEQKDPSSLQLKSPSIVNYISRSTRDLTNGPLYESDRIDAVEEPDGGGPTHTLDKKGMFLRNLQNRAPELYRTLHEGDMCRESRSASRDYLNTYITRGQEQALGSRIPVGPNKDTASIVPRSGSSPDDYSDQRKHLTIRKGAAFGMADQQNLPIRYRVESDLKYQRINDSPNVGGVVIELRNNS